MNKGVLHILLSEVPDSKLGRNLSYAECSRLAKLGYRFTKQDIVVRVNPIDPDYGEIACKTAYGYTAYGTYVARASY